MKKMLIVSLIAGLLFSASNVSAMTEAELKAKLTQEYTINGEKFSISSDMKVMLDKYLEENEISSSDADYIASKWDDAIAILKSEGVAATADADKLSSKAKSRLTALVRDVDANTSVNIVMENGVPVVKNADGTTFAKISEPVKRTGKEVDAVRVLASVAFVVTAVGAVMVVRQVKNN